MKVDTPRTAYYGRIIALQTDGLIWKPELYPSLSCDTQSTTWRSPEISRFWLLVTQSIAPNPSWQMPGRGRYNRSELFCDWPNMKSAEMKSPLRPEPVVRFQCTGVSGSKMELFVQFAINSSYACFTLDFLDFNKYPPD
jgi:hypothetical protein